MRDDPAEMKARLEEAALVAQVPFHDPTVDVLKGHL